MVNLKPQIPAVGQFIALRQVLEETARAVPSSRRTSAVKACLADKILTLSAGGETDPDLLGKLTLQDVRASCPRCNGCAGLAEGPKQSATSSVPRPVARQG